MQYSHFKFIKWTEFPTGAKVDVSRCDTHDQLIQTIIAEFESDHSPGGPTTFQHLPNRLRFRVKHNGIFDQFNFIHGRYIHYLPLLCQPIVLIMVAPHMAYHKSRSITNRLWFIWWFGAVGQKAISLVNNVDLKTSLKIQPKILLPLTCVRPWTAGQDFNTLCRDLP